MDKVLKTVILKQSQPTSQRQNHFQWDFYIIKYDQSSLLPALSIPLSKIHICMTVLQKKQLNSKRSAFSPVK